MAVHRSASAAAAISGSACSNSRSSTPAARSVTGIFSFSTNRRVKETRLAAPCRVFTASSPTMYGSYHHITVMGKEAALCDHKYDVVGGLCENNDKFAIDRMLPRIDRGDLLVLHAG